MTHRSRHPRASATNRPGWQRCGASAACPTDRRALAILALFLDRLGRHESAATIAGFAPSDLTDTVMPEINAAIAHVRQILGDASYESLVRKGEGMTTAAALAYAYDQIDQARATLDAVSE